jgi:hypothetical protein
MERFDDALNQIQNAHLRNLTAAALLTVKIDHPYFFTAAASTSGRYHPEDECAVGGLVTHTLRTVDWGLQLCRAWALGADETDAVIAALILHDTGKRPAGDPEPYDQHPDRAADLFLAAVFPTIDGPAYARAAAHYTKSEILMITAIESAIRHHMGPWTREEIRKPVACYSEIERAVYTADYCASRRELAETLKAA